MDFRTFLKDEIYAQIPSSLPMCRAEWWGIFRGGGTIKRRESNSYLSFSHTDLSLIKKCLWLKNKLYPHLPHFLLQKEKRGINAGKWYSLDILGRRISGGGRFSLSLYLEGEKLPVLFCEHCLKPGVISRTPCKSLSLRNCPLPSDSGCSS